MATKKTTAKTETKAPAAKTAAKTETKTTAAKTTAAAKTEAKPATKTATKAATTKAAAKTEEKAAPAKKPAAKKTAAAKEVQTKVYIEFNGAKVAVDEVVENVKATYKANGGKAAIKTLEIYVKPDEQAAYFVVNGELDGNRMDVYFC